MFNTIVYYVTVYKPLRSVAGNLFMNTISIENENRRSVLGRMGGKCAKPTSVTRWRGRIFNFFYQPHLWDKKKNVIGRTSTYVMLYKPYTHLSGLQDEMISYFLQPKKRKKNTNEIGRREYFSIQIFREQSARTQNSYYRGVLKI